MEKIQVELLFAQMEKMFTEKLNTLGQSITEEIHGLDKKIDGFDIVVNGLKTQIEKQDKEYKATLEKQDKEHKEALKAQDQKHKEDLALLAKKIEDQEAKRYGFMFWLITLGGSLVASTIIVLLSNMLKK